MTFSGFPARSQATAIPNAFFSDILPQLADDPAALGVALYAFNLLLRKKGSPRFVTKAELAAEPGLASYFAACDATDIDASVRRVAETGMLNALAVEREGHALQLYFLNTPADRRGMEAVRRGDCDLVRNIEDAPASAPARSSVYALYESTIGTVSPLVADELAEAERLYPADWLEAAFREAAVQNARSWRYVSRILERWTSEGKDDAKAQRDPAGDDASGDARYFRGKYGRILRQRLQP